MLTKVEILGSSSSGNAYVLTFDDGKKFQFDCGVKNDKVDEIEKVFLTHSHIDHSKYVDSFKDDIVIKPSEEERSNALWTSFIVPHKVLCNGYTLKYGDEKIIFITDCGNQWGIKKKFKDATILFIECNWDKFLIQQGIIKPKEHSKYAFSKEGHMSNLDCLNLIAYMEIPKECKIIFCHKSQHHADYDNTYKMFDSLPNKKYIAKKGDVLYCKSWKVV